MAVLDFNVTPSVTPSPYTLRIEGLVAKGWTLKAAEKRARKERRLQSPQHKAAVARRVGQADDRFEVTGNLDSYNAI